MGKLTKEEYAEHLRSMQAELNEMARWVKETGQRMLIILEGRDTAGKGGAIRAISERLNPRMCHVVALAKPSEREATQMYVQRYVQPSPVRRRDRPVRPQLVQSRGRRTGDGLLLQKGRQDFLERAPRLERAITDDGILLFKYYLTCDQEEQEKRFQERLADPLKRWKLSPIDLEARAKYDDYTKAREAMLKARTPKTRPGRWWTSTTRSSAG